MDRVSRKYGLLINIDKTKVVPSGDVACSQYSRRAAGTEWHLSMSCVTNHGGCWRCERTYWRLKKENAIRESLKQLWKVIEFPLEQRSDWRKFSCGHAQRVDVKVGRVRVWVAGKTVWSRDPLTDTGHYLSAL